MYRHFKSFDRYIDSQTDFFLKGGDTYAKVYNMRIFVVYLRSIHSFMLFFNGKVVFIRHRMLSYILRRTKTKREFIKD